MTGFENNSDVVRLAATAPLFNKVLSDGAYRWTPDAIWFDNDSVWYLSLIHIWRNIMENSGIILETKNIKKTFVTGNSEVQALKGVSFCLKKGEILAVMGGSGSGKSTILNILGALLVPDEGCLLYTSGGNGSYPRQF